MKPLSLSIISLIAAFSFLSLCAGCREAPSRHQPPEAAGYYTFPMHPRIHQDSPGLCPICGMKLLRVASAVHDTKETGSGDSVLSYLTEPVTRTAVGPFTVIEPVATHPKDTITADGSIGFDQRGVHAVSARVTGRIEKLYVRYSGQSIRKGQRLMDIYSPELVSAERNLLQAIEDKDQKLTTGLKEQLYHLGMGPSEIQKITEEHAPLVQIPVYSPYNGIVLLQNTAGPQPATQPQPLGIREGMYVQMGQTVFTIQNIHHTWAVLHIFDEDLAMIRPGDSVILSANADPGQKIFGRVDFIPPYRSSEESTTGVRIYLDQLPTSWKIGTLIHGRISVRTHHQGWYVPLSAVNRLGMRSLIWVRDKKHEDIFHAREVKTGVRIHDSIEIISGLHPGDQIAKNASYMMDSESFYK